ncbi:MAG TPA: hypothetical protein VH682_13295 [Gemmataceae bacterium]|jgi:hypothetical protein
MPRTFPYKSIPIFINARDLFAPMARLVDWLLNAGYTRVHILDNDSSYPPLLEYYERMRKDIRIIPLGVNVGHTAIWDLKILERLNVSGPFVYSDPDIVPIAECPPHVVDFFLEVLRAFPNKTKVGFGLCIDDLPDHYKFKRKVIVWESQFWETKLTPKLYDAPIDTTFALYRPGSGYDLCGIRSGFPYMARHAPWYENLDKPSADHAYYIRHAKAGTNNWSANELPAGLDQAIQRRIAG